jgi:hypothetical protein
MKLTFGTDPQPHGKDLIGAAFSASKAPAVRPGHPVKPAYFILVVISAKKDP